jgi:ATP-dependent Clp protease adapter protein ClpS
MHDVNAASAETVWLVFHKDDKTPKEFVHSLIRTVFAKSERDARATVAQIHREGASASGPYPAAVAKVLLDECERRVREAGHPLRVTSQEARDSSDEVQDVAFAYACEALDWHFSGTPPSALVTRLRRFPLHMQADVQVALARLFSSPVGFFGIRRPIGHIRRYR